MNYCQDCIWKQKKWLPSECPKCGAVTLYSELDGPTLSLKCISCGFEIAGASFFPHCHLDEDGYSISIESVGKEQYLKVAKVFGVNVVELKRALKEERLLTRSNLSLDQAIGLIHQLQGAGLQYQIVPDPLTRFPEILHCTLR